MTANDDRAMPFLDLYGADFQANPHEALRQSRERHWCANTAMGIAVLRYQEIQALLANRQFRTPGADMLAMQGITEGPMVDAMNSFLLSSSGEAHDRVRHLVSRAFTVRSVEAFRPRMAAIAGELLDELDGRGECDFMAAFANPYACRILCEFVGIPLTALDKVEQWNADIALMFGFHATEHAARVEATLRDLDGFIDDLAAQRRLEPGNDLISGLVTAEESGELLTTTELRAMVITLLSAGTDTVSHQLGNAIATFIEHPEQWRALAAAPELAAQTVEEIIRFNPAIILGVPRIATEDVEWNGLQIQRGACLLPMSGSANRDAAVFTEPATFDITQARRPHLTFGGGIHYCLGAALGRAELQEALPLLARRLRDLRRPDTQDPGAWRPPTEAVYGPLILPIAYSQMINDQ